MDIQEQVLRDFTVLHRMRADWGGAIVLSLGLNPALAFAASIAGAVSLSIDNEHMREAVRACDFVVTTLDEALRIMKNEVRKRAPVSVGLDANPLRSLDEIVERGLIPQFFTSFLPQHESIAKAADWFRTHGTAHVDFSEASASEFQRWQLRCFTFNSLAELRAFDARALAELPLDDTLRRRWLTEAPRILHRLRPFQRALWHDIDAAGANGGAN